MAIWEDVQPPTGAARKARERRARAQAKHAQWLMASCQALASHHTHRPTAHATDKEVRALRGELDALSRDVAALRAEGATAARSERHTGGPAGRDGSQAEVNHVMNPGGVAMRVDSDAKPDLQGELFGGSRDVADADVVASQLTAAAEPHGDRTGKDCG